MPYQVKCPACGVQYTVKDEWAGKKFACRKCEQVVRVPKPTAGVTVEELEAEEARAEQEEQTLAEAGRQQSGEETESETYGLSTDAMDQTADTAAMPALPPKVGKKKSKKKKKAAREAEDDPLLSELKQGFIGGYPISILVSVLCGITLIVYCLGMLVYKGYYSNAPATFYYMIRALWITWLTIEIFAGKMRGRYISILLCLGGLFWGYCEFAFMLPAEAKLAQIAGDKWGPLISFYGVCLQMACWSANLIALLMPTSAKHCEDM